MCHIPATTSSLCSFTQHVAAAGCKEYRSPTHGGHSRRPSGVTRSASGRSKDRLVRLFRSIEHAASEVEHQRVVLDGLIDDQRAVPGVEPVDFDGLAERLHRGLVGVDRSPRRSRVVAALDDQHGRLDVLRVRDRRAGRVALGLLLRRAAEARGTDATQRVGRVLVGDGQSATAMPAMPPAHSVGRVPSACSVRYPP